MAADTALNTFKEEFETAYKKALGAVDEFYQKATALKAKLEKDLNELTAVAPTIEKDVKTAEEEAPTIEKDVSEAEDLVGKSSSKSKS